MGAGPGLTLGPLVPSLVCVDWQNESIVLSQCLDLRRAQGQHSQQLSHTPGARGQGSMLAAQAPAPTSAPASPQTNAFSPRAAPLLSAGNTPPRRDFFSGTEDPDWEEDFAPGFRHSAAVRLSKSLNSLRLVSPLYQGRGGSSTRQHRAR